MADFIAAWLPWLSQALLLRVGATLQVTEKNHGQNGPTPFKTRRAGEHYKRNKFQNKTRIALTCLLANRFYLLKTFKIFASGPKLQLWLWPSPSPFQPLCCAVGRWHFRLIVVPQTAFAVPGNPEPKECSPIPAHMELFWGHQLKQVGIGSELSPHFFAR